MRILLALVCLVCAACGTTSQPDSNRIAAAYEVPLPTAADKAEFLDILNVVAADHGFHVDARSPEELRWLSHGSPMTFGAGVWRGADDDEIIASAEDFADHLGLVWIMFDLGEQPQDNAQFMNDLMPRIMERWPDTVALPIMPSGTIPSPEDMIRTPTGYQVKPSAAHQYRADQP